MKKKLELLAPGGDIDSIKAAIVAGADAIYCGLDNFNARNRATNIKFDDLSGIIKLAHSYSCKIFLTLNIVILEHEIPTLIRLLNKLANTKVDGVIVQDLGVFYLLSKYYKDLDIHASTQVTTHNEGQIAFLKQLGASRVNLSRELNIDEIKSLTQFGHENSILSEVFVHGSNCIGFSGLCYISSAHGGNSGNRGRCSQPCRDKYETTHAGKDYPLNLKDNSAFSDLEALSDAGVDSLKIEGRVKKPHYVYTVVNSWRSHIDDFIESESSKSDNTDLYKVFNRDFSNAYLTGDIGKDMFIDNPRDHSVTHFTDLMGYSTEEEIHSIKKDLYGEKTDIINNVNEKIKNLSIAKPPLTITVSGALGSHLSISAKSIDITFTAQSKSKLKKSDKYVLDKSSIQKRLKGLDGSQYHMNELELDNLQDDLFVPFQELTTIRKQLAFLLNDSKTITPPLNVPKLKKHKRLSENPRLSVLISSSEDIDLDNSTTTDIYYQLPDCIADGFTELVNLFSMRKNLLPWFPSIILGDDYTAAVKLLLQLRPKLIVTNNTGIAYEAYKAGIDWIAGPYLNVTNSFSLLCMKESFNCYGSFISNEIDKRQMQRIACPENFKLYYSIYHPALLLTSRQCLFHQTTGCKKEVMDEDCLPNCNKSTSIINLKQTALRISKKKGEYNSMHGNDHFLNTEITTDLPDMFSSFLIDLRNIKTATKSKVSKAEMVRQFKELLEGLPDSDSKLKRAIHPTCQAQYIKGL